MTDIHDFTPNWTSSPGDTIADILDERQISLSEFAKRTNQTIEETQALIEGRTALTIGLARKLENLLGSTVQFWMSRDYQYRQDVSRLQLKEEQRGWLKSLPASDMIKFGWIKPTPHPSEEVDSFLDFFGLSSVNEWQDLVVEMEDAVTFKISTTYDSNPASLIAWLRQGEIEAGKIKCSKWNKKKFEKILPKIRKLTRVKKPNLFLPKLQNLCSECGVAVVVVRTPSGCPASGASRFITEDKALIMLSFRYLSDDHFWFSFFHEAAHLILHGESSLHLTGVEGASASQEDEANKFATNILVPLKFQEEMIKLPNDSNAIIRFATKIGIAPGIIVGQLQKREILKYSQMNFLKRRYHWAE